MISHEDHVRNLISLTDKNGRLKCRERNDLEFKESFGFSSSAKYAKTMAAFTNNHGGYIIFGIKDNPRVVVGVNHAFDNLKQEMFTESLNSLFSPEIIWEIGTVEVGNVNIGYIYSYESLVKPTIALKHEASEKINSGDVFYRYRGRSEKIKYPEMVGIIEARAKQEREQILKLMETIRKSDTTNLGIINYNSGRFSTPYGTDIAFDKRLVMQVLRKAKYIKAGSFDDNSGRPVLKVTGEINLTQEIPVPNIEPDVQYPYLQKNLAEKLKIGKQQLYALIWYYKIKGQKKYHMEVTTSATGKVHKFSAVALQYLAEKLNENKDDESWLAEIAEHYRQKRNLQDDLGGTKK